MKFALRIAAGALPNLIVIGSQKCGTSVLHYYLSLHPEVSMSKPKELNFFIEERNWPRGIDWYRGHFDPGQRLANVAFVVTLAAAAAPAEATPANLQEIVGRLRGDWK